MSDKPENEKDSGDGELHRGLKPRHIQLIALGGIIGSGYFLGTGAIVKDNGPGAILAYLLGGLAVYTVMTCLGELASHIPIAGSFVSYANTFIHPVWGCAVGWSYWLTWVSYVPAEMLAAGIIMNKFIPAFSVIQWALAFGVLITAINLFEVGAFGETEFWLALIKIVAIAMFGILAFLIWLGFIGDQGSLGTKHLLGDGGFFPMGVWAVFPTMVIILVNFQGSEIIGIAAAESEDPMTSIPDAVNAVTHRIIALYVIPVLLLVSIFPWREGSTGESIFALALTRYGLDWAGNLFSFVVLTAAVSCSNSGLYATSRALFALAREGMAPSWLGRVTSAGVPRNAILLSVGGTWAFLLLFGFAEPITNFVTGLLGSTPAANPGIATAEAPAEVTESALFTTLLALSGFTGGVAWISICMAQFGFRMALRRNGIDAKRLKFSTPWFPYFTAISILIQIGCLLAVVFREDLRISAKIGVPLLLLPAIWYLVKSKREKLDLAALKLAGEKVALEHVMKRINS